MNLTSGKLKSERDGDQTIIAQRMLVGSDDDDAEQFRGRHHLYAGVLSGAVD